MYKLWYRIRSASYSALRRSTQTGWRSYMRTCALIQAGVRPGNRVTVTARIVRWRLFYSADTYQGNLAGIAAINFRLTAPEVAYILGHSGTTLVLVYHAYTHLVPASFNSRRVVESHDTGRAGCSCEALLDGGRTFSQERGWAGLPAEIDENAACCLCYTSGTTGRPKGLNHFCAALLPERRLALPIALRHRVQCIGLVSDAAALARAGFTATSAALEMVANLRNESHQFVWFAFGDFLSSIQSTWFENEVITNGISKFRQALYTALVETLGYDFPDGEDTNLTFLRKRAIVGAAAGDSPKVVEELKSRFRDWMKTGDDSRLHTELISVTFLTAVRHGHRKEYEHMKKIHDNPKNSMQKICAIQAMGAVRDLKLIKETLDFALHHARDQDLSTFFTNAVLNTFARREVVQYFKANYDAIMKRTEGNMSVTFLVKIVLERLSSLDDVAACDAFFKDKDTSKYSRSLQQAIDTIRANAEWIERSTTDVEAWLQQWK